MTERYAAIADHDERELSLEEGKIEATQRLQAEYQDTTKSSPHRGAANGGLDLDGAGRHRVDDGESMWSIARHSLHEAGFTDISGGMIKHEIRRIAELNSDAHPSMRRHPGAIQAGWQLQIEEPETVQRRQQYLSEESNPAEFSTRPQVAAPLADEKAAVVQNGQCLEPEIVVAEAGKKTHVFDCQKVTALSGANVVAHAGSEVDALRGSFVLALPGSRVHAFEGARVGAYKTQVDARDGSQVLQF